MNFALFEHRQWLISTLRSIFSENGTYSYTLSQTTDYFEQKNYRLTLFKECIELRFKEEEFFNESSLLNWNLAKVWYSEGLNSWSEIDYFLDELKTFIFTSESTFKKFYNNFYDSQ